MKNLTALLFFYLQLFLVFGQSQKIQKDYFDQLIELKNINKKEVQISLKQKEYTSKIQFIQFLTTEFGEGKLENNKIIFSLKKHKNINYFSLDTTNQLSINLIFSKNITKKKCQQTIYAFQIMMKRELMYWQHLTINNKDVYFVGHRGGLMNHYQENTNDILFYSKTVGVSYVEVDVLISNDTIPFVGHDWKYLEKKLQITKSYDSTHLAQTYYKDGQNITFLSTLLKKHQFLILDLIHNTAKDQKKIINYLYKKFPKVILSNVYLQIDNIRMYKYIESINPKILISYNYRTKNTRYWRKNWILQMKPYFDNVDMFVINPSARIGRKMIRDFGEHAHKIIPVIYKNNIQEIQRMVDLGFQFLMIDDVITITNRLQNEGIIELE